MCASCDTKFLELVDKVLKEAADNYECEQKFSDKTLLNLYKIFGTVFERALDLYEQDRVTHILVSDISTAGPLRERKDARYLVQVKGLSGALYTLFPDVNYCSCLSFRHQVLNDRCIFTCKHVLAAWLASVSKQKLSYQYITEEQFHSLLSYQVSSKQYAS